MKKNQRVVNDNGDYERDATAHDALLCARRARCPDFIIPIIETPRINTLSPLRPVPGTNWVDVPGGNVTANNLVWRKFIFSQITTSKIRVLTNASTDGWSRVTEVEAYQAAANSADIRWMVSDQLGTPRMIADKSGSLAGISRHDYLPFGEELDAGTGEDNQFLTIITAASFSCDSDKRPLRP